MVFLKIVSQIQQLLWKRLQKIHCNVILHYTYYLSIALSKILHHSKTIKKAKKLSVFGENDSRRLYNFLQVHIF